jgi:hypothetical protein
MLSGHKRVALEIREEGEDVSIHHNIRINPYDFIKSLVDQVQNCLGLYVPPTAILQLLRLKAHFRTFLDPSEKSILRRWIEEINGSSRNVSIQA